MMLVNLVEKLGYDTLEAADGKQALEKILEHKDTLSAILLDLEMPVMNGMKLLKHLKKNTALRHLPVVIQTASEQSNQIAECLETGAHSCLIKPLDLDMIKSALSSALQHEGSHP